MAIELTQKIDRAEWESFLQGLLNPPFLQSWQMREIHQAIGDEPFCFAIRESGQLVGIAFAALVRARRGTYLYLPYGPVFSAGNWKHLSEVTEQFVDFAQSQGVDFLRSSPFLTDSSANQQLYRGAGWRPAPIHMLAEHLWWLDISPDEATILKGMRKTMRNLIRRAEKEGVTVRSGATDADVETFIEIHEDTVERQGFVPYSAGYFKAQVQAFRADDQVLVYIAEHENRPIAASIMMFYGDMASYHHGASLSAYRQVPASYLIQWQAIQEAKRRGCSRYNFWGIVPDDRAYSKYRKRPHPWIGLSKFKQGFGGEQFDLLHCQDYPLTPRYQLTRVIETARRIRRGH